MDGHNRANDDSGLSGPRAAWQRRYAREPTPWRGPVHAEPLLRTLSGRVVELGAAGGKVRRALPSDALGIDWVRAGLAPPALVADVQALPLRARGVDALVAIHVLGHLLDGERAAAVAEWARVLRPGGACVVEVFATGDAREGSGREVEPRTWERDGVTTHHFEAGELDALFAEWEGRAELDARAPRWGARRVWRAAYVRPGH